MKIGIVDSGVGGLLMAKAIVKKLPQYDYVYLGDTARVPYGDRSDKEIDRFFKEVVQYLFEKKNCALVIVACNTMSAVSLRKLQQGFLKKYPKRRVLGMVDPTLEEIVEGGMKRVAIIATAATIRSNKYKEKLEEMNKKTEVFQQKTPEFVPLIEAGKAKEVRPLLKKYLDPLFAKKIDALVLGCTHYPILKKEIRAMLPKGVTLISQDEFVPAKLKDYLKRHKDMEGQISKKKTRELLVTKVTPTISSLAKKWFGKVTPQKVNLK